MLTTQVASQLTAIGVQLFILLILPLIGYVVLKAATIAPQLLTQWLAGIKDVRIRTATTQLVATAEATLAQSGPAKLNYVLDGLKGRFPGTPVDLLLPAVEHEVAQLHMQLGTFTPAKPGEKPVAPPVPVLDQATLRSTLANGLSGLVPASLTDQVASVIDTAFNSAVTTIDKAMSPAIPAPVAEAPVVPAPAVTVNVTTAPTEQPLTTTAVAPPIILPASATTAPTSAVTEPTPL